MNPSRHGALACPASMATAAAPVRLLKFITNFYIGGTERQFMVLERGLDRGRFDVRAACLRKEGPFLSDLERDRVPVSEHRIGTLYHPRTLALQVRLAASLRRERIHIVHTYGFYPNTFAIAPARAAGVPVIVASIRDIGDIWTPLQRRIQKTVCRLAHAIAVNAEAVRRRLVDEGYDPRRITVIPNGIDLGRFSGGPGTGRLRREIGVGRDTPLVGVVSRLNRDKGLTYLLGAAAELLRSRPGVRFVLFGDGPARAALEAEAGAMGLNGKVHFMGFRTDIADLLREIDLSVLPSLSEAMSNVVLESMAAERPVIATRVGGLPEVLEDGVHGCLVPPADAAALAQAMHLLLGDAQRARAMGRAGREHIARHFSQERMIERTEALYERLLKAAAPEARG
jgi:glycosyltransferase involved in cell wall biosynthesis